MEDVLLTFKNNNLSDEQAKALLKGKGHLEKILDRWQEDGTGHMDSMWEKAQEYKDAVDELILELQTNNCNCSPLRRTAFKVYEKVFF